MMSPQQQQHEQQQHNNYGNFHTPFFTSDNSRTSFDMLENVAFTLYPTYGKHGY